MAKRAATSSGPGGPAPTPTGWALPGPDAHDEVAVLSTARLSGLRLGPVPGVADPPDPGWTQMVDDRGVFVRRTRGRPGATPVWYVHGLAGASSNFNRLAGALSPHAPGYAVDLPGSGHSDPPPRGHYSLRDDAALVAELIRTVTPDGPVHVVGNSLGGVVATMVAAREPGLVRSLTLISPAVPDLRLTRDRGADPRLAALLLPGTGGVAERRLNSLSPRQRALGLAAVCFGDPEALTEHELAVAARELQWQNCLPWNATATVRGLRSLMRSYLRLGHGSFAGLAATVAAPTLVVWGTRDRLVDVRLAWRTAHAFPDNRLLVLAGAGHVAQMEAPEPVAGAMLALWQDAGGHDRSEAGASTAHRGDAVATSTS